MQLVNIPTKTEQIVRILRQEIVSGSIAPGTRMDKVRELASRFGVSLRIVSLALERLQDEGLIVCKRSKGIFVREQRRSKAIEVFLLLFRQHDNNEWYARMLLEMTMPPHLRDGFRFITRSIFDEHLTSACLNRELETISRLEHLDCLLLQAENINPSSLPAIKRLNVPTIFLGDFASDQMAKEVLNQVAGDPDVSGRRCVEFLRQEGYRESLLLMPLEASFYKLFLNEAQRTASDQGIKLYHYPLPFAPNYKNGQLDLEDVKKSITLIDAGRLRSLPAIVNGIALHEIAAIRNELQLNIDVPWVMPVTAPDTAEVFRQAVFDHIARVVAPIPPPPQRLRVPDMLHLQEIGGIRLWAYDKDRFELVAGKRAITV